MHPHRTRHAIRSGLAVLFAASLMTALTGAAASGPERPDPPKGGATFTNPVHEENFPDPQAIRSDGSWWAYATNGELGNVQTLRSTDLVDWTPVGDALPELPAWADAGRTWAPEVIELAPDRYALYYTAAARDAGRQCIGVAIASRPQGPFVDSSEAPLVCQADEGGSIDANPFRDADGTLWLTWKNDGNAVGVDTWLQSAPLAADGLSLSAEPTRLLRGDPGWEGGLVEAPFLWRDNGRLFLFYSANGFATADYAVGYATCESPTGPCTKAAENPILSSSEHAAGPGHMSLVEKDGRTWMLYHAWPPDSIGEEPPGRRLWIDEVTWEGGRPVVHGPTHGPQPAP
ncbi:beta-xylosidase [Spinactinospora alkalitolerans]|uniref:Beta-xylosidase n=1 Tax=Spinactinospora alkalitolerans TaxID=687207 RepID=A0A852U0I7_9ACTN|nr:glycoside hydrolase family 43 protein [Spinactinospora alkalitolerans]NYE50346.1 beta-xylosidase [Spinactinospora alkalitolerans]